MKFLTMINKLYNKIYYKKNKFYLDSKYISMHRSDHGI